MVCSTKRNTIWIPGDLFMPGSTCTFDGKCGDCIAAKIQCHFAPNYPASRIIVTQNGNPRQRQSELRKNSSFLCHRNPETNQTSLLSSCLCSITEWPHFTPYLIWPQAPSIMTKFTRYRCCWTVTSQSIRWDCSYLRGFSSACSRRVFSCCKNPNFTRREIGNRAVRVDWYCYR